MSLLNTLTPFLRQRKLVPEAINDLGDQRIADWSATGPIEPAVITEAARLPSFNLYAAMQQAISCFGDHVFNHPKLIKHNNVIVTIDEEYMPSYQQSSGGENPPLTSQHPGGQYSGIGGSTLSGMGGSMVPEYTNEVKAVQATLLTLEELHVEEVFDAVCPSGYVGQVGELWYCRFVPSLHEEDAFEVAISTPYILRGHPRSDFEAFIGRQASRTHREDAEALMTRVFKYSRDVAYWLEFVLQAYLTHSSGHIELQGLPDVVGTKLHEDGGRVLRG